jgi:hypothetical protein
MIWNAIMRGGSKDGVVFDVRDPVNYPGLGYNLVKGIAVEYYWYTGKTDEEGRFIFRSEGLWWLLKRRFFAKRGYRVVTRPRWAPKIRHKEEEVI